MEDTPKTREHNNNAIDAQRQMRDKQEEIKKQKGFENASDVYIRYLIFSAMWDSEAC